MKKSLKHALSRIGVFPVLDGIRRFPQVIGWAHGGCAGPAPPPIKRRIIAAYLERYQIREFIETGTHLGDTLACVAQDRRISCRSIELDMDMYRNADNRFRNWSNVRVFHGDSGEVLPVIMEDMPGPALFWLDGHYSGGDTAKGESDTPVSKELQAIIDSKIKEHVILIDDARCFNGTNGYPFLDELLMTVRRNSEYRIEVSADIIRLTPCKKI